MGHACHKWLTARGVEVLLNTREAAGAGAAADGSSSSPSRVVTVDGRSIAADVVYRCAIAARTNVCAAE